MKSPKWYRWETVKEHYPDTSSWEIVNRDEMLGPFKPLEEQTVTKVLSRPIQVIIICQQSPNYTLIARVKVKSQSKICPNKIINPKKAS